MQLHAFIDIERINMKTIYSIIAGIALCIPGIATANSVSIGGGVGWSDFPYKRYGSDYFFVPHIDYDNGSFYIDDLSAGVYAYNEGAQSLSFGVRYLPMSFKPSDSDDRRLKQLSKRHSTVLAEVEYELNTSFGSFSSSVGADVLDESNSVLVNADYSVPFMEGDIIIVPKIGVNWANSQHNNYYFGVTHRESARSTLRYHNADSSFTPYVELSGQYALTKNISTYGGVHIDKLTGDAADSPMVDNTLVTSVVMGVSYRF